MSWTKAGAWALGLLFALAEICESADLPEGVAKDACSILKILMGGSFGVMVTGWRNAIKKNGAGL